MGPRVDIVLIIDIISQNSKRATKNYEKNSRLLKVTPKGLPPET